MESELSHIDEYEGASLNYGGLFLQESGQPMVFSMQICQKKKELTTLIQHHGGVLLAVVGGPHTIRLSVADHLTAVTASPCFRHQFILDCVQQQRLQQLADYRIDHGPQYSPIDLQKVLMGLTTWADVHPLPGLCKRVPIAEPLPAPVSPSSSFSSDDDAEGCRIRQKFLKQRYLKNRREYSHEDRAAIVRYILDHGLLGQTGGRAMWQKMAHKQVVGNDRTWQSIKEHFRRQLVPHHLSQLGLTDHQKRMFLVKFPEAIKNYQDLPWPNKKTQMNYRTSDPFESFNKQNCSGEMNLPGTSTVRTGTAAGARYGIDATSSRGTNIAYHNNITIPTGNNVKSCGGTLANRPSLPSSSQITEYSSAQNPPEAYASECSTGRAGLDFSDQNACSEPSDQVDDIWGDESEEETQQLSQSLLPQQTQLHTVLRDPSWVANAEVRAPNTILGNRATRPLESLDMPESCSSLVKKAHLKSLSKLQTRKEAVVNQSPSSAAESVLEVNVVLLPGQTSKEDGAESLEDQQQRPARRRLPCSQRALDWASTDHLSQAPPAATAGQSASVVHGRIKALLLPEEAHKEEDRLHENTEELGVQLIKVVSCDAVPEAAASPECVLLSSTDISLSERHPPHGDADSIRMNDLPHKHDDVSSKHEGDSSLLNNFSRIKIDAILAAPIVMEEDSVSSSQDSETPLPTPSDKGSQDYIFLNKEVSSSQDSVVSGLPNAPTHQDDVSSSQHDVLDKCIQHNTEDIVPHREDSVSKPLTRLTVCQEGVHPSPEWVVDSQESANVNLYSRTSLKSSTRSPHQIKSPRGRSDFPVVDKQGGDDVFCSDKMAAAARKGVGCSEDTSAALDTKSPNLVLKMSHQGSSDTEIVPDLNDLPIVEDGEERVSGGYLLKRSEYIFYDSRKRYTFRRMEPLSEDEGTSRGGSDAGERESLSRAIEENAVSQLDETNKSGTSVSRSDGSVSAFEEEESLLSTSKAATYPSTSPSSDKFTSDVSVGVAAPPSAYGSSVISRSRSKRVWIFRSNDAEGSTSSDEVDRPRLEEGGCDTREGCTGLVNSFGARIAARRRAEQHPQQTTSCNDGSDGIGEDAPSVKATKRPKYGEARDDGEGNEDPPNFSSFLGSLAAQTAAVSPAKSVSDGTLSDAMPPADGYSRLKFKELRVTLTPLPADGGVPFDEKDVCSKRLDSNKLQYEARFFKELCLVPKPHEPFVSHQPPPPAGEIMLKVRASPPLTGARSSVNRKSEAVSSFESLSKRRPGSESSAKSVGSTRPTLATDLLELPLKFPCQPSAHGMKSGTKETGAGSIAVIEEPTTIATFKAGADSGTNIISAGQGDATTADEIDADKDLEEDKEMRPSLRHRPSHRCILSGGRRAYTADDRVAMVTYILDNGLADQTGGNAMWQRMARLKVVGGGRTWQSIKEHFRRQLVPHHLAQLGLTDQEKRILLSRYPEYIKKYNLADSDGAAPTKNPPNRLIDQSDVISTSGSKRDLATPRPSPRRERGSGRESSSSSSDDDFDEEPQPNKRAKLSPSCRITAATKILLNRVLSPDKCDHLTSSCGPSNSHESTSHNNNNSRDCQNASRESPRKIAVASFATVSGKNLHKEPNATLSIFPQGGDVTARLRGAADTLRRISTSKPKACGGDVVTADSGELETKPQNLRTNNTVLHYSADARTTASTSGNDYKMLLQDWDDEGDLDEAGDKAQKGKRRWRSYCREEDMLILRFLLDTRRWREVGGRAVWTAMQSSVDGLRQRSWHSLKERYRKVLLPRLGRYPLTPDERGCLRG